MLIIKAMPFRYYVNQMMPEMPAGNRSEGSHMDEPIQEAPKKGFVKINWILLAAAVILTAALGIVAFGYLLPNSRAVSAMPEGGELTIHQQEDGTLLLSWPKADRADHYCIEIHRPGAPGEEPEMLYREFVKNQTSMTLPALPESMELTLQVRSVVEYRTMTEDCIRYGENSLSVTTAFRAPTVTELRWFADPDANTLDIKVTLQEGDQSFCYLLDEHDEIVETRFLEDGKLHLTFGEDGDYPVPGFEESYHLAFAACRQLPGLKFYGNRSSEMTVVRDHLLGRTMTVKCIDRGNNVWSLIWNETKGESYEVQLLDENTDRWNTVYRVPADGELSYTTDHLPVFSQMTFRVVAVGGQVMEGSEYAAVSNSVEVTTAESPIYATVWPVKNLTAYTNTSKTETAGTVKVGTACCVLEETGDLFTVMLDGEKVYIESSYCMINLPEYMGDLCNYEITNSVSSIYMVHEFAIPRVTGVVTKGYEQISQQGGNYLVPLLYPTAQKLVQAGLSAMDQGYRLKIYDSFRPYAATREIYDRTAAILDDELPEKTYTGVSISGLGLPAPKEVTTDDGETKSIRTYRMVMTGSGYSLGSFLAKNGSMHNLGIAVDLTLEELDTGKELKMQTSMHDLSRYSVLSRNNTAANTLAKIMKDAGFGDLTSEWWHFQDNESRSTLSLVGVKNGVTGEGWMADDHGWKYRKANGSFYRDTTISIDGTEYTFDAGGYVQKN